MNRILILYIVSVAIIGSERALSLLIRPPPAPAIAFKPPPDLTKECAEEFKNYHECIGEKKHEEDTFRHERRQDNNKEVLQECFANNKCTPPQLPPLRVPTPEQQACRDAFRAAKRVEIQKCVNRVYPSYVFGNEVDRNHVGDNHLSRLLELSVDHCSNKQVVLACIRNKTEWFRKTRYQLNCGIKEYCRVLMSEKCQDHHFVIKHAKCECKKQVKQVSSALRASVPACRLVPPEPQRPAHDCPNNGFCSAGYLDWLKHHPPPPFTNPGQVAAAVQAFAAPAVAAAQAAAGVPEVPAGQAFPGAPKPPLVAAAPPAAANVIQTAAAAAVAIKPTLDLTKECTEEFKIYRECIDIERQDEDKFRQARRQNNTKEVLRECFANNKCTPPQLPPLQVPTPEQRACRDAVRSAKRVETQKCVNKVYPTYVFGNAIDRDHIGDNHISRLLGLSVDHCSNKQVVLACIREKTEWFRQTRYQLNCGIKENCRVLMSEKCQDHQFTIKHTKCECKKQVKQIAPALRANIPACRLVPQEPQRPGHDCPANGFCRAGYQEWLKHHPPPPFTKAVAAVQAVASPSDLTKECAEDFKIYHKCSGEKRHEEDKFRQERRQDNTKEVLQECFVDKKCPPPQLPPLQVPTPAQQACQDAFRAAKRAEIQKCVNKVYPSYVFGNEIDRNHVGDNHLYRLLGLTVDHCSNKQDVQACIREKTEWFRKSRYQLNCGIKENCRVLMSEKCQNHHYKIKNAKCQCKKQVKQIAPAIRASIPACRLVPSEPQRPAHDCPNNGFCRAGYLEWLKNHPPPAFTKAAPAVAAVQALAAPVAAAAQALSPVAAQKPEQSPALF